jgi:hypothetical protein
VFEKKKSGVQMSFMGGYALMLEQHAMSLLTWFCSFVMDGFRIKSQILFYDGSCFHQLITMSVSPTLVK